MPETQILGISNLPLNCGLHYFLPVSTVLSGMGLGYTPGIDLTLEQKLSNSLVQQGPQSIVYTPLLLSCLETDLLLNQSHIMSQNKKLDCFCVCSFTGKLGTPQGFSRCQLDSKIEECFPNSGLKYNGLGQKGESQITLAAFGYFSELGYSRFEEGFIRSFPWSSPKQVCTQKTRRPDESSLDFSQQ